MVTVPQDGAVEKGYTHRRSDNFGKTPEQLMHDTSITDGAVRLYSHMHWRYGSNCDNHEGRISMGDYLGVTNTTITNRVKELVARDWVIAIPQFDSRGRTTNFYHVFERQDDCRKWRETHNLEKPIISFEERKQRKGVGGKPAHKPKGSDETQVNTLNSSLEGELEFTKLGNSSSHDPDSYDPDPLNTNTFSDPVTGDRIERSDSDLISKAVGDEGKDNPITPSKQSLSDSKQLEQPNTEQTEEEEKKESSAKERKDGLVWLCDHCQQPAIYKTPLGTFCENHSPVAMAEAANQPLSPRLVGSFNPGMLAIALGLRESTVASLVDATGINGIKLSAMLAGTAKPTEDEVKAIGKALQFPDAFFFREGSVMPAFACNIDERLEDEQVEIIEGQLTPPAVHGIRGVVAVPKSVTPKLQDCRALTVKREWAERIGRGDKTFEVRNFKTDYRGPVVFTISGEQIAFCVADLDGIYSTEAVKDKLSPAELEYGKYAWRFVNARYVEPVKVQGKQGLWTWTLPIPDVISDDEYERRIAAAKGKGITQPDDPKITPEEKNAMAMLCYGTLNVFNITSKAKTISKACKEIKLLTPGMNDKTIEAFGRYWKTQDFRGKKGQRPEPRWIPDLWMSFYDWCKGQPDCNLTEKDGQNGRNATNQQGRTQQESGLSNPTMGNPGGQNSQDSTDYSSFTNYNPKAVASIHRRDKPPAV